MPEYICSVCSCGFCLSHKQRKGFLEESELFCSVNCISEYIRALPIHPDYVLSSRGSDYVSTDLCVYDQVTNIWYRSWFEVYFARFLSANHVLFEYETITFTKNTFGGESHYTPDFWLPVQNLFVEVKGLWLMSGKSKVLETMKSVHLIVIPYYLYSNFKSRYVLKNESKAVVR